MFHLDLSVRQWRDELAAEGTMSRGDIDELEDHLRLTFASYVESGQLPDAAFEQAQDDIGPVAVLSTEFGKIEETTWYRLIRTGWVLFIVSFFLPVHEYGIDLSSMDVGSGQIPGIEAFAYAIQGEMGLLGTLSALTNILVLITMWGITRRGRNTIGVLTGLVICATLLNFWWLTDGIADLRVGYYTWSTAFGAVAAGLGLRAKELATQARMLVSAD